MSTSMPASPSRTSITVAASRTSTMSVVLDLGRRADGGVDGGGCAASGPDFSRGHVPHSAIRPSPGRHRRLHALAARTPDQRRAPAAGRAADPMAAVTKPGITRSTPPTAFKKRSMSSFVGTSSPLRGPLQRRHDAEALPLHDPDPDDRQEDEQADRVPANRSRWRPRSRPDLDDRDRDQQDEEHPDHPIGGASFLCSAACPTDLATTCATASVDRRVGSLDRRRRAAAAAARRRRSRRGRGE